MSGISGNFNIVYGAAEGLSNSKGLETDRIHFNDLGDQQLICDLAIKQLENRGRDIDVDSLNCFTNLFWSVMDLGNGEKVLLNRNSAIKRLGALGVDANAVKAALNSNRMERIHDLILQRRNQYSQETVTFLRTYADRYVPGWFNACQFPEGIHPRLTSHIYNNVLPELAQITTEEYVQLYRSPNRDAAMNTRKAETVNPFYDNLRALVIPYVETYDIYARLEVRVREYLTQNRPGLLGKSHSNLTTRICADLLSTSVNREIVMQYARLYLDSNPSPTTLEQDKDALIQRLYNTLNEETMQHAEQNEN